MPPKKVKLMKTQPKTVEEWLEAKVKYPQSYPISPEGLLISPPSKSGDTELQIPLHPRRMADNAYIQEQFVNRQAEIKEAEEQFTASRRNLYTVVEAYEKGLASAGDVVLANQQVKDAEAFVIEKATAPRFVDNVVPIPEVRQVLMENQYMTNKMADPVYNLRRSTFPWTHFYKLPEPEPVAAPAPEEQPQQQSLKPELTEEQKKARTGAIIAARKRKIMLPK
jgi:hypothetical protein